MRRAITFLLFIALNSIAAWFYLTWISAQRSATQTLPSAKARKRALLIGISKYERAGRDPGKEWWDLNTDTDIKLLAETLIGKFQFDPKDIKTLTTPQETTHKAIVEAFRKYLIEPTQPSDIIFFHFSGHGQSIPDDNDDEFDGYDESLVPSDYVSRRDASKNIRDDEIGALLDELKQRRPVNVTITLDSCFSGAGARGDQIRRGGPWEGPPVTPAKVRGEETSASGILTRGVNPAEGYVFISATSSTQEARETQEEPRMGVFTWALVKTLVNAGPTTTYRDLFERLNDLVTRKQGNQNPQLEGDLDKKLLDGTALAPERYIRLTVNESTRQVLLQAGRLQGMTKGSRFGIYSEGTKSPQEGVKLADAEIVWLDPTSAMLKLSGDVSLEKLRTARAFETEHFYDDSLLKVATRNLGNLVSGKAIQAEIKSFELAEEVMPGNGDPRSAAYDVLIHLPTRKDISDKIVDAQFRGVILERPDGSVLATIAESPGAVFEVKQALEREVRWQIIKSLETTDSRLKIELKLVPVDIIEFDSAGRATKTVDRPVTYSKRGLPELKIGDYFRLEVKNSGEEPVWITILNLRTDGKIGHGWPQQVEGQSKEAADNKVIDDKRWRRLPLPYVWKTQVPAGLESMRAIATRTATDFTPLIDVELLRRGDTLDEKGRNAANSPLGKILRAAQLGQRSGLAGGVPPAWAVAVVNFDIRKE